MRGESRGGVESSPETTAMQTSYHPRYYVPSCPALSHIHTYVGPSSLFSPTPSLCSMVSHKYNMRSDARTFNLSGMGCSAGVISLDLAKVSPVACPPLHLLTRKTTHTPWDWDDFLRAFLSESGGSARNRKEYCVAVYM